MIISTNLKKIFGSKYYDIVINYIKSIQNVISDYDVVVFMARKAYCFYNAVLSAGLISENTDCIILSSRMLTFDNYNLEGKKVALVEDVVVEGNSLLETINSIKQEKLNMDIYIAACQENFPNKFMSLTEGLSLSSPYVFMSEKELLELATLLTNYIICEMIPYNVDYPIYKFKFNDINKLYFALNQCGYCSILNLMSYKKTGVDVGVIHLKPAFKNLNNDKCIVCKIRLYIDLTKKSCILMPITILPDLEYSFICNLFNDSLNEYKSLVEIENKVLQIKNMYKVFQYLLSKDVVEMFLKEKAFQEYNIQRINSEPAIFSKDIHNSNKFIDEIYPIRVDDILNSIELYQALGIAYDLIIKNCNLKGEYNNEFTEEFVSFDDIILQIKDTYSYEKTIIIASLILDVFIDNGIVVPRMIINSEETTIKRVYKFGEVARLTIHDFKLFSDVLYRYADCEKRMLEKTELEKISVLFFRKYNNCFNSDSNEAESYRICFSKFGPRISASETAYSVNQGDALTDKLKDIGYIKEEGKEINILINSFDNDKVPVSNRELFSNGLSKIHKFYVKAQTEDPENIVFKYIYTYTKMLTLFSIGDEEIDKILSLIAEVYLVKKQNPNIFTSQREYFVQMKQNIDGVISGIWKYFCYMFEPNLLKETCEVINKNAGEDNTLYIISEVFGTSFFGKQLKFKAFVEELGSFLCRTALLNYYGYKHYKIAIPDDYFGKAYTELFAKSKVYVKFDRYFNNLFCGEKDLVEAKIQEETKRIFLEANYLIDKFQILENTYQLNYSEYSRCFVLFHNDKNKTISLGKRIKHYTYENMAIIPVEKKYTNVLLKSVLDLLDDANINIVYLFNERKVLLATQHELKGNLFKKDLLKIVEKIITLKPNTSPEIYIVEDVENQIKADLIPNNKSYDFNLYDKTNCGKKLIINRYSYNKKEMEAYNMEVKVEKNYGYIIGEMNGDINSEIKDDFENMKKNCKDDETTQKLDEGIKACNEKNKNKVAEVLKWLGDNAMDFVKTFASDALKQFIFN